MNLFVEGYPAPVLLRICVPRSVTSLSGLTEVSQSLSEIKGLLSTEWHKLWPAYKFRRHRETYLVRFNVTSNPVVEILTDPAWLAVFLTVWANYERLGTNTRRMARDIRRLLGAVRGLTSRERQLLEIAVKLTLERLASRGEDASLSMARRFHRARVRLLGAELVEKEPPLPEIEVIDITKKETHG